MTASVVAAALLALVAAAAQSSNSAATKPAVVCFVWSVAMRWLEPGKIQVADIDSSLCTHLIYCCAGLDPKTLNVISLDPHIDLEDNRGKGSYKKFSAIAENNPNVTTLLSVGGWSESSRKFSDMAASSYGRKRFAKFAAEFVAKYGFGGLNLAWLFPTMREGRPEDKANFVQLLQVLRHELGKRGLMLTVRVSADPDKMRAAYDAAALSLHVDLINLMTYDFYGAAWNSVTAPSAPLTATKDGHSVEKSVDAWIGAGAPAEKLVVAVPFYARTYVLANPAQSGMGAPSKGPGAAGDVTKDAGTLAYFEMCMKIKDKGWIVDKEKGNFYAHCEDQWASYEPESMMRKKAQFVLERGLAGVMVWLEGDDVSGVCGDGSFPLLRALNEGLECVCGRTGE